MNNPTVEAIRKAARVEIEILCKNMKVMETEVLAKREENGNYEKYFEWIRTGNFF